MIILASNSPRRKELLSLLGYNFKVIPADCDENINIKNPKKLVKELSFKKAKCIKADMNDIVIGSDTVVAIKNKILGKPKDTEDAFNMLNVLSGKTHTVHTGITVIKNNICITKCISSKVKFRKITHQEILDYIKTNEPMDKAGAYAVQGKGSAFVKSIKGDYFSIVGFPCSYVDLLLKKFGEKPIE